VLEASPYTPGFGVVPEVTAGRTVELERHVAALRRGPRDPYFTQAVIGERGVGKTVYLSLLAQQMTRDPSWIVVRHQARAGADSMTELLRELPEAAGRSWRGRDLRSLEREISVEVNAVVLKVGGRLAAPADPAARAEASPAQALRRALRAAGARVGKRHSGVLVAIDEAQELSPAALADVGMIAQTVAHGEGHPVAIAIAGTPELSGQLLRSGSFLERMPRTELGMLSRDEARLALLEPANARGVIWEEPGLNAVCSAAGGYPYFVQLGGHHAWEHATDPDRITAQDALSACRQINDNADRMFRDRWARLGPAQRAYLATVAISVLEAPQRSSVATRHVAAVLGKQHSELTRVRSSLINDHHLLRPVGRGEVEFAIPRFGIWLQDQIAPHDENGALPADPEFSRYAPPSLGQKDAQEALRLASIAQPRPPAGRGGGPAEPTRRPPSAPGHGQHRSRGR
jgi:AAA ATPase domain